MPKPNTLFCYLIPTVWAILYDLKMFANKMCVLLLDITCVSLFDQLFVHYLLSSALFDQQMCIIYYLRPFSAIVIFCLCIIYYLMCVLLFVLNCEKVWAIGRYLMLLFVICEKVWAIGRILHESFSCEKIKIDWISAPFETSKINTFGQSYIAFEHLICIWIPRNRISVQYQPIVH